MKNVTGKIFYNLLSLLVFIPTFLSAQTNGKLTGKIINTKNEPVPGVSISVQGLQRGTSTDMEGRYTLAIPGGKTYTLTLSAIGYTTKSINDLSIKADQTEELNVVLETANKQLNDVVVRASSTRREAVNALIQFQKNTNTVASVISAEAIRRSPDRNTGEVLKRVPGTSIQEGKYLVVRGLADRYNQAMLNGILLSSTEPDRKTFSFDLFPAPMIDNIIMNKAFVPELPESGPGDWYRCKQKKYLPVTFLLFK
jgi:uncharacterized membrane protein